MVGRKPTQQSGINLLTLGPCIHRYLTCPAGPTRKRIAYRTNPYRCVFKACLYSFALEAGSALYPARLSISSDTAARIVRECLCRLVSTALHQSLGRRTSPALRHRFQNPSSLRISLYPSPSPSPFPSRTSGVVAFAARRSFFSLYRSSLSCAIVISLLDCLFVYRDRSLSPRTYGRSLQYLDHYRVLSLVRSKVRSV